MPTRAPRVFAACNALWLMVTLVSGAAALEPPDHEEAPSCRPAAPPVAEEEGLEEAPPLEAPPGLYRSPGNPEDVLDALKDRLLAPRFATNPAGVDSNMCMSWEASIASDPNDTRRITVMQGSTMALSSDGGDNFTVVSVGGFLPPGFVPFGDGSAAYDAAGRLFVSILGNPTGGGGWQVFVSRHDPVSGALLSGPVNVSSQINLSPSANCDKPWIAADAHAGSSFANRVYVVWSVTGGTLSGSYEVWGAFSTDQGASWSQMTRGGLAFGPISPLDASDGSCWPAHVAVGSAGDVFVSYHGQPGFLPGTGTPDGVSGKVVVLRSFNGGSTFPQRSEAFTAGKADTTSDSQGVAGAIPDARFWTIGTRQAWLLPDPATACTLHVVTTDDPDNDPTGGDAADVVMATSTNCGVTWAVHQTVSDGPPGSWQLLPTAAIDPQTGAIAVTWLDNRDAASYPLGSAGNARADLRARYSLDGGADWLPSRIVNDVPIDPDASSSTIGTGLPPTYRIGEYNGVAFGECSAHMVWAGQATCNGTMDTYYDRDPEVGDLDPPQVFCPPDVALGCNDPTSPDAVGRATARDQCDAAPGVIFVDQDLGGSCPPSGVIDSIERIWSSTDAAGNIGSCSQLISINDFDPPVISLPPPLNLECNALGGVPASDPQIQGWLAEAGAQDACSSAQLTTSGVPALFPLNCGGPPTAVTFSSSDQCGNADFAVSTVTVTDTTKPTLATPIPTTFECTSPGGTPRDDPSVAAWLATAVSGDACSVPAVADNAPALLPAACSPGVATRVTFTSTDGCGNQTLATSTATVVDTTGPMVSGDVPSLVLGPPDHLYRCFDDVSSPFTVSDACASLPLGVAVSCSSSQCDDAPCPEHPGEDGDGNTVDDCTYDPALDRVCARAERAETDPAGRFYDVVLTATDSCGNARPAPILRLFVPHGCAEGDDGCLFSDGFESGNALAWSASAT